MDINDIGDRYWGDEKTWLNALSFGRPLQVALGGQLTGQGNKKGQRPVGVSQMVSSVRGQQEHGGLRLETRSEGTLEHQTNREGKN